MVTIFDATEISGLAQPTYNSGATNKKYVDTISGNLDTRIDSLFSYSSNAQALYAPSTLTLNRYNQYVGHSGNTSKHVSPTISSNAKWAQNWLNTSGSRLSSLLGSGNEYSANYTWYNTNNAQLSNLLASGNEYSQAYASAQIAMYKIVHADDLNNWNSALWNNSSLIWDNSLGKWKPQKSGSAAGGGSPGGSNAGDIQYRIDASTFGGETNFNYDSTNDILRVYHISAISISAQNISGALWTKEGNNIYFPGEVHVAHAGWDCGDYKFQVSGPTFYSGNVTYIGELSGLADPTYPSGAANKHYVDSIGRSMTFSVANVRLLSGQNLNMTRFQVPTGKTVSIWDAAACNSGGASAGDLYVEMISSATVGAGQAWGSVFKTSSAIILHSSNVAIASTVGPLVEIRFMYSSESGYGSEAKQLQFGTGFMNVSIDSL